MKIFLGLSALIWLPYGIFCLANPGFLAEAAGVHHSTPTGLTELRAMYGGLQAALGVLAAAALVREDLARTALTTLAFVTAGLGSTRLLGMFIDASMSEYTAGAIVFEFACAITATVLLRRAPALS